MDGYVVDRADGWDDGEDWTENYKELPGGSNVSIIIESTSQAGVLGQGVRLGQTATLFPGDHGGIMPDPAGFAADDPRGACREPLRLYCLASTT
jgi:hypothetical protein